MVNLVTWSEKRAQSGAATSRHYFPRAEWDDRILADQSLQALSELGVTAHRRLSGVVHAIKATVVVTVAMGNEDCRYAWFPKVSIVVQDLPSPLPLVIPSVYEDHLLCWVTYKVVVAPAGVSYGAIIEVHRVDV